MINGNADNYDALVKEIRFCHSLKELESIAL